MIMFENTEITIKDTISTSYIKMFDCKRCGTSFKQKGTLKIHLSRKKICKAVLSEIPVNDLIRELPNLGKQTAAITYPCTKCNKLFNHKRNMYTHRKSCDSPQIIKTTRVDPKKEDYPGQLYIIHIREFWTQDIPIYKVGRSRDVFERMKSYPKKSILIYASYIDNIKYREELLLERLKQSPYVTQELEYGLEYFRGDPKLIKNILDDVVNEIMPKAPKEAIKVIIDVNETLSRENIHVTIDENENVSREHIFQILDDNKE